MMRYLVRLIGSFESFNLNGLMVCSYNSFMWCDFKLVLEGLGGNCDCDRIVLFPCYGCINLIQNLLMGMSVSIHSPTL